MRNPGKITNKDYVNSAMNALSHCILRKVESGSSDTIRRGKEISAYKAKEEFFAPQQGMYRGRPLSTLPVVLNNFSRLENNSTHCFKSSKDIDSLRNIAEQRHQCHARAYIEGLTRESFNELTVVLFR
ncbi:hypothetical protein ElyMa_006282300 [Elysia marginata]|uniref:Uncharacterized protein n=1 Tax=Elysia marginata TaxID=1093978 RepID=A0AAV4HFK2_9GAST|nr:hypothetical protein ElyMa_006282300 [Elysia marginata]